MGYLLNSQMHGKECRTLLTVQEENFALERRGFKKIF
jgi:hypothetical protein